MMRKTEPTSVSEGLAAGLQSRAAVWFFFLGLINQFLTTAKSFARRMIFNATRAARIKSFLIFLMTGFGCVQLHGITNGFETLPPEVGSIKWQEIQRIAKERQ